MNFHNVTQEQIENFVSSVQAISDKYYQTNFSRLTPSKMSYTLGHRYTRIVKTSRHTHDDGRIEDGQSSVYCFIDMTNGDVLKAAGWKAPAKNFARGNLNDDKQGLGRCGPYSAQ